MPAPQSLPWSWYSDPEVLRREQERIFRRSWQYVGHAGRVDEVGQRFAGWAGDVPVRLEAWGPFLFVNPDLEAAPLAETLGPVPDFIPVEDLVFHSRDESELAANWKIGCENYLECYHCPVAHKGFSAAYDVDPDE